MDDIKVHGRFRNVMLTATLAVLIAMSSTLVVQVSQELRYAQNQQAAFAHASLIAREQSRCFSYLSQNTLRQILLANPKLTPKQVQQVKMLIPLPSLYVMGDKKPLNCNTIVAQPVPR